MDASQESPVAGLPVEEAGSAEVARTDVVGHEVHEADHRHVQT